MFQVKYKINLTAGFLKTLLLVGSVTAAFTSCKKVEREEIFPASLTVVNGINDNSSFISTYFGETTPKFYNILEYIYNGRSMNYTSNKANQQLTLYINNDTLNKEKPLMRSTFSLESAGIYTHFVYGSPAQIKALTIKENLPLRSQKDSVAYLRVINLFDSRSIDIVQLEPAAGTIVTDLKYEQLSNFIKVPVNSSVQNFRFEVKDHATGNTIASLFQENFYPGSTLINAQWLFKARTMLVTGKWTDATNFSVKTATIGHF